MPKIKTMRKPQKISAMELVERAGLDLNQPLMSAVESGKVLFTPDDLQAVCEALQCTPLDLYDNPDEFDLMAVQRKLGASVRVAESERKPLTVQQARFFARLDRMLPPANPKRQFRMADDDYDMLLEIIKQEYGYNSVGAFLKSFTRLKRKQA